MVAVIGVEFLVDLLAVLVLHGLKDRLAGEVLEDVGGDVEPEDGGEGAEDREDPDLSEHGG